MIRIDKIMRYMQMDELQKLRHAFDPCMNYITSLEEERRIKIDQFACKDMRTRDSDYNTGLRRIRKVGYNECKGEREVKYYCLCNNL